VLKGNFLSCGEKYTLLKVLSKQLFYNLSGDTSFSTNDTLLIDNSPEKSIYYERGNAIFLDNWSHRQWKDNFLLEKTLPWL